MNDARIDELGILRDVPLAPRTTLELGGHAEYFVEATDESTLVAALEWARVSSMPVAILGGGSNVIIPDAGIAGLVLAPRRRGMRFEGDAAEVDAIVASGESWDPFVAATVDAGLAGLECLSGIPGLVGATPIQNVGAYGVETSDRFVSVDVYDRTDRVRRTLFPNDLAFAYRDSALKHDPARFVVVSVRFRLVRGGAPTIRYAELAAVVGEGATIASVRENVLALRRRKSMVVDSSDPNRRSAGSFFTNPIVSRELAAGVFAAARAKKIVDSEGAVPRWEMPDGRVKLAAGWLIEQSGIRKGMRRGNVGVSSKHALGLVHHGGGSAAELLAFADEVAASVRDAFGVELEREPVVLSGSRDS